ncbi:ester cyclase [Sphingobacterium sp. KU25419]|nr:ester cyclase [Sphingobacterium sp. KU25419]
MKGPAGYMAILQMMRSGFPDIQWHAEDILVDGDKVVVRYAMNGTHQGDFFSIPAV